MKGDVLPFCYLDEGLGAFTLPPAEEILAKRAVVLTCGAAGLLREGFALFGTMPHITFTHVLMDEAGQVHSPPQSQNIAGHLSASQVALSRVRADAHAPGWTDICKFKTENGQFGRVSVHQQACCCKLCIHLLRCMQALLPEALVPLTLLRHEPGCKVLLCGDPK